MAKRKQLHQLIEAEDRAERTMRRAFNAWQKARTARVRAEKKADREAVARGGSIGGECDVRELAAYADPFNDNLD